MQNFILAIAATMIGGSIFAMAMPKGNLKKIMTFTLNLFFISSLLSPFVISAKNIDLGDITSKIMDTQKLDSMVGEQTVTLANENLKRTILILLKENGYKVEELNIEINLEGQNTSIEVILNEEERKNEFEIEKLIRSQTGIMPKVVYCE